MREWDPRALLGVGFALVLLGAILPWLMVTDVIPRSIALSFFAAACSVAGIFLGIAGSALYVRRHRD